MWSLPSLHLFYSMQFLSLPFLLFWFFSLVNIVILKLDSHSPPQYLSLFSVILFPLIISDSVLLSPTSWWTPEIQLQLPDSIFYTVRFACVHFHTEFNFLSAFSPSIFSSSLFLISLPHLSLTCDMLDTCHLTS